MQGICTRPPIGIAGEAEVVLHADLGGVLDLADVPPSAAVEAAGGHRAGDADFALAADFGAGDRGVFLVEDADRAGGEQEVDDAVFVRARAEALVVVQHRRDDAGRAVGRRGDDAAAGGVFLVHRQRVEVDPVEDGQRIAQRGFRLRRAVPRTSPARGASRAGRRAACRSRACRAPRRPASPSRSSSRPARISASLRQTLSFAQHQLRDRSCRASSQSASSSSPEWERIRQRRRVGDDAVFGRFVLVDDEAAADRVVVARRPARRRRAS